MAAGSFTSDEQDVLFNSNKSAIFNVYSIPVKGGAPKPLTNSTRESTYLVTAFPADARFLYRYDKGGNENEHIYLREVDGSERDLTPGEKTKANFLGWSQDRKSFFFSTNERDPKFFDIFEMPIAELKPALIYKDETGYEFADSSRDKRCSGTRLTTKTYESALRRCAPRDENFFYRMRTLHNSVTT